MSATLSPLAPAVGSGKAFQINSDITNEMRLRDLLRRDLGRVECAIALLEDVAGDLGTQATAALYDAQIALPALAAFLGAELTRMEWAWMCRKGGAHE